MKKSVTSLAIISAMDKEIAFLHQKLNSQLIYQQAGLEFFGDHPEHPQFVFVQSGIGKVNAALATQILIDVFSPKTLLNFGVVGLLQPDISFDTIILGDRFVQHDFDTTAFGDRLGQIANFPHFDFLANSNLITQAQVIASQLHLPTKIGTIVTGDQFIANQEKITFLAHEFQALACDMEAAAIAHVANLNQVPLLVVKTISDSGDDAAQDTYQQKIAQAINLYQTFILELIKNSFF